MNAIIRTLCLSLLALFSLSACDGTSTAELKLISDYEYQLGYIFEAHMKNMKNHSEPEQFYQQQLTSVENFAKVKKHFAKHRDMEDLNKVIEVYEYAIVQLYRRNALILEASKPLWNVDANKLKNVKQYGYYAQQTRSLSELERLTTEFDELLDQHQEKSRKKIVNSGLPKELRTRIWPVISRIMGQYVTRNKPSIKQLREMAQLELQLTTFLFENRNDYSVDPQGKLLFSDYDVLREFNDLRYGDALGESIKNFRKPTADFSRN